MGQRLELQALLVDTLGSGNVYFQPPPTVKMAYPCIVYKRDTAETKFSGNRPYNYQKRYSVTVITEDVDSSIPDEIAKYPMCIFERFFTSDGLNHDVFNLFF